LLGSADIKPSSYCRSLEQAPIPTIHALPPS
jgi:hypothetical protein